MDPELQKITLATIDLMTQFLIHHFSDFRENFLIFHKVKLLRTIEYIMSEETHKDHQLQLPAPSRTT